MGGGGARTEQYGYDELNRLKTVDYGDGQTQSYAFDAMGNRSSKVDSSTGTEGYTYNAANMLLSRAGNNYTNDVAGNTLTGGGRTNTWDSQNRLVQCIHGADTSSFVYGSDGLRRQSTVNGTTTDFVIENSMFVRERRAGANFATYLVGARGPEYRRDDVTGQIRWYLYDGLGSVLGEVDPNGTITTSRKFDVYGAIRGGINPSGTSKHKFVGSLGHPSDDDTGLTYMRARYYDPAIGRFASEDENGHGLNLFAYCSSNPVNRLDQSGHEEKRPNEGDCELYLLGLACAATAFSCLMFAFMKMPHCALAATLLSLAACWCFARSVAGLTNREQSTMMSNVDFIELVTAVIAGFAEARGLAVALPVACVAVGAMFADALIIATCLAAID